jgi:hypothetical protein
MSGETSGKAMRCIPLNCVGNRAPWRRARQETRIGCDNLPATGITAYLEAGGTLENAPPWPRTKSPRTTKLYDRRDNDITLDEVERTRI